jgi:hypothetical protein
MVTYNINSMEAQKKSTQIISIFPTPLYITNLKREFSVEELSFVDKNKLDVYNNEGNQTSNDNYILNNKLFKDLKIDLDLQIQDYFDKIISPENNITPYITQSWLNFTKENEYHHIHNHPNSIVSGVLYINADKNNDKIVFSKHENSSIEIEMGIKNYNVFNTNVIDVVVETGYLILFPSSLKHRVLSKKGNNTRISLAFNTFIKGKIGNNKSLTELYL